jgi:uncharacterized protein YjbJ (UPF0337 family)
VIEMNEDIVKGNWKQLSGKIKQKWAKLTDDDLLKAEGSKDYLLGKLQEYYGLAKDKVEQGLQELGYQGQGTAPAAPAAPLIVGTGHGSPHKNGG